MSALRAKDLQLWRLRDCEVESGLGQEAVDEAGPVLHPFEPVFISVASWSMPSLVRLARDLFRLDQTASVGLS